MDPKKVIIVGATGSLGSKIVKALLEQGAEVTAMVRGSSNRSRLSDMGVKSFVIADMMDKASLKEALSSVQGFDAIVASAAGYTRHTKGDNPETDVTGYRNLVDASREAGIPRFVLISILECDKATTVPHFHNKYLIEKYLADKKQPYIALRAGAFLDQSRDFILAKIKKGIMPVFFEGSTGGMIYTPDLARYAALAAIALPDSALNTSVDVGWSTPADPETLAAAFSKVLGKPVIPKPLLPPLMTNVLFPLMAVFSSNLKDMLEMIKWVKSGQYISRNTQKQMELFGELPTIEEAVTRYCRDRKLI